MSDSNVLLIHYPWCDAGFLQATGWPSVVAVMGNWYGKGKRGAVMGVWNAHTSVGNILGSVVAAACLSWGWGWAFLMPGAALIAMGLIIWLFLVVEPEEAGLFKMRDSILVSFIYCSWLHACKLCDCWLDQP